jgi:type VI secretion system protein ImpK
MSQEDPFASFESDRTFIMPSPGQRGARTSAPRTPDDDAPGHDIPIALEALTPANGLNPIVTAASPLLSAVPPLRASLTQVDATALRDTLAEGVRAFERKAHEAGVDQRNIIAARYILCTFIDEAAAGTPWGGSGAWGRHSLLVMFHNETWGGEKVFQLMAKLAENPAANRDLLELLHVVLALGFEGRYRVIDGGRGQLAQVRERLHSMLRQQRGEYERDLSPHAKGIEAKRGVVALLPMWVVFAVVGVLAAALYLFLSLRLNTRSDPVFAQIQALRPQAPAPFVEPAPKPRLSAFLQPEIRTGLVAVDDLADRSVITIRGDGLFEPGSATVDDRILPLLQRIAEALDTVGGAILITGHTDSQPIRSARFPSNWHLSQERARSVQALLAQTVQPSRMRAEGRADAEPVAGNATAAERARNRRVEITLFVSSGDR